MPLDPVLRSLLTVHGVSGFETAATAAWLEAAKPFSEVRTDTIGSGIARVAGTRGGPTVAVMGHIDEIGLIVTYIDEHGFISFRAVGSWDPQVLVSQRVDIATRDGIVTGVIGKKPIHLSREEKDPGPLELKQLHIDIGATSREDAASIVDVGDVFVIAGEPIELRNGRIAGRSLDNRLGSWVALEVLRLVHEAGGAAGDVIGVAAAQEENSHVGAQAVAYELRPDIAVIVDVHHETHPPDIDARTIGAHTFGEGPSIDRGSILHPGVVELLRAAGDAERIPYVLRAVGTPSQTDADSVHSVRAGIPCAVIGLPLRYMHSSVEMAELADIENAARLIAAFCLRLDAETRLSR
jgi:putative aminopeptidase FrvX